MKKTFSLSVLSLGIALIGFSQTVTIGNQVWMTKNLDVSTFRNGDAIPQAKTAEEWWRAAKNKQPAWCYFDYDATNAPKDHKLYNWYAVIDPRGLAPTGYHIPTKSEWWTLKYSFWEFYQRKDHSIWNPDGYRTNNGMFTDNYGLGGGWWRSTGGITDAAWLKGNYTPHNVHRGPGNGGVYRYFKYKRYGFSVRCLKD